VATWDDTAWIGGTASGTSYRSVTRTLRYGHAVLELWAFTSTTQSRAATSK